MGNRLLAGGVHDLQRQVVLLIVDKFEFARQLLDAMAEETPDGPAVGVHHFDLGNARVRTDHETQPDPLRTAGIPPIIHSCEFTSCQAAIDRPLAYVLAGCRSDADRR